jgi:FAD/FMN-containing dehydrogenase
MHALLTELQTIVGAAHVLHEGDLSAWEKDWRGRARGRALAVVRPGSTEEVAQVVQACARHRAAHPEEAISIVPQGGNTGLVVGSIPDDSGRQIVLSLQRMNKVRAIDPHNLTITLEAGCVLQNAQDSAHAAGFLYPLSLGAEGTCTIGGNLGTNAGGTQVVRYGNTREQCLGLEVVTAQGEVWQGLSGLRKDNTGYDLRHLYIGSEGTLGIITAACMKLYPLPQAQVSAWAAVPDVDAALTLLGMAHKTLDAGLTGFELIGRFPLQLVEKHCPQLQQPLPLNSPYYVLLENSRSSSHEHASAEVEQLMEAALEQGIVRDVALGGSLSQTANFWKIRESITMAQATEGLNIKHDISVPISSIPAFVAHTDAVLEQRIAGVRVVCFGHLGDGNLHYNVQAPAGIDTDAFLKSHEVQINDLVFDAVAQFGGSISAEHGVGSLKVEHLKHYKSPVALAQMRAIKAALDPHNLLNPGRVVN